jgi:hypothetical protein
MRQALRRFPPPWSVEEQPACFVVRDHNGKALAYVHFEDESGRRSAAKLLTRRGAADRSGPLSQNKARATPNSYWNGRLDKGVLTAGATQTWRDNYDNPEKSNNGRRAACRRNHASDGAKRSRDRCRTAGCGWSGGQPCCARTARTGRDSGSASPVGVSRDQNRHRASSHVHVGAPQNAKNRPVAAVGLLSI